MVCETEERPVPVLEEQYLVEHFVEWVLEQLVQFPGRPPRKGFRRCSPFRAGVGQAHPTVIAGKGPEMSSLRAEAVPARTVVRIPSPEMLCLRGKAIPVIMAVEVESLEM